MQVRLGDHDISAPGVAERVVAVGGVHVHEQYKSPSYEHDIALLELAEEVDLNTYTPACMAQVHPALYCGRRVEGVIANQYEQSFALFLPDLSDWEMLCGGCV